MCALTSTVYGQGACDQGHAPSINLHLFPLAGEQVLLPAVYHFILICFTALYAEPSLCILSMQVSEEEIPSVCVSSLKQL